MGQFKKTTKKKTLFKERLLIILVGGLVFLTGVGCTAWSTIERWLGDSQSNGTYVGEVSRKEVSRFVKSTRQAKGNAKTHYLLASFYVERSRFGEAIEEFKKAILIDRTHVKAYNGLGVCYDRLGFHKDAQQYYRAALQVNPKLDYLHNNLGYSYIMEGAYEDAIDVLERAIAHGFSNPAIYNNLGLAYARTDRYELALEAFLSVGDKAAAHQNMAVEYEEAGMNEKAREHYEIARAIESGKEVVEEPKATEPAVEADTGIVAPTEIFAQPVMVNHSEKPTIIETDLTEPENIEENEQSDESAEAAAPAAVTAFGVVATPTAPSAENPEVPEVIEPEVAAEVVQTGTLPDLVPKDDDVAAPLTSPEAEPASQEELPASVLIEKEIASDDNEPAIVEVGIPVVLEATVSENQPVQSGVEIIPAALTAEIVEVNGANPKVEETVVIVNDQPMITNKSVVVTETQRAAKSPLLASLDPIVPVVEQLARAGLSAEVLDNLKDSSVSIQVSNGCGVRNIAHTVQDYLRQRGFHVVIADDADHHAYSKTMVYYIDPHLHDAFDVAQQIPLWQDMDQVAALRKKDVAIRILLGKDMGRFMQHFKEGVSQ